MTMSTQLKLAALAAVAATSTMAITVGAPVAAHDHGHKMTKTAEKPNIVQTAQSTGVHNTLVAAVTAAGLGETLSGEGPFTVFAPTDDAFAKLPEGTVATLVKPENKGTLTTILTYHVVAGKVKAGDLVAAITANNGAFEFETLSGGKLTATLVDGSVVITDAAGGTSTVTTADVKTSNGIIHVTDGVFLPN